MELFLLLAFTHLASFLFPWHLRRLSFPDPFLRRLSGHVVFTTLHRYYSAVRLLTEHHSPLRLCL